MRKTMLILATVGIVAIATIINPFHNNAPKITKTSAPSGLYVAMGDSVAAGVGLETYSDASACNRTNQSYPKLVAARKNLKLVSLACSGATLNSGITGAQTVNDLALKPQLEQLFALPQPQLITLTIGANDLGWTELLTKCSTSTCGSAEDTALVDARLAGVTTNLQSVLQKIAEHYGSKLPRVVVTGYYQLLPATLQSCPEMTSLDAAELNWQRTQEDKLNVALRTVVASQSFQSFSSFAAINFATHELCTDASWVQNISAPAPFHPTDAGQQAYAKAVL
jgi:lysophospholipase L1-like esterase